MSEFLTFKITLEFKSTSYLTDRPNGRLHELYTKWIDGGRLDADWEDLSEFVDGEIEINDLDFWVEDVRLVK